MQHVINLWGLQPQEGELNLYLEFENRSFHGCKSLGDGVGVIKSHAFKRKMTYGQGKPFLNVKRNQTCCFPQTLDICQCEEKNNPGE